VRFERARTRRFDEFLTLSVRYEQLCRFYPDITEYKIYLAQSAFKSCNYELAIRSANSVQEPQHRQRLLNLIAACEYEQEDLASCKGHLDQCIQDEADTVVAQGCVHIKEGDFDRALERFDAAMKIVGYQAELAYNVALCHYKTKQFGPAMKNIAEIIEKGVREHPELGIGSNTEGMDVRSVGNTAALRQTALIEAFNLKAALEYGLKNFDAAREALSDMPPRSESELDPVTLHNQGLLSMDTEPNSGFKKLNFLLSQPPFPNETFSNLVILYCKYGFYDQAADVLAQNVELSYKLLRSPTQHRKRSPASRAAFDLRQLLPQPQLKPLTPPAAPRYTLFSTPPSSCRPALKRRTGALCVRAHSLPANMLLQAV
jgi:tetratricopeptide repeat protein 30